jgi:putative transposase
MIAMNIEIIKGYISRDHVHLLVSVTPYHSVSMIPKRIEGKTSRRMLCESRILAKQCWGRHLWSRSYFATSSGNVTDEVIAKYIEQQTHAERACDGDFTVDS